MSTEFYILLLLDNGQFNEEITKYLLKYEYRLDVIYEVDTKTPNNYLLDMNRVFRDLKVKSIKHLVVLRTLRLYETLVQMEGNKKIQTSSDYIELTNTGNLDQFFPILDTEQFIISCLVIQHQFLLNEQQKKGYKNMLFQLPRLIKDTMLSALFHRPVSSTRLNRLNLFKITL